MDTETMKLIGWDDEFIQSVKRVTDIISESDFEYEPSSETRIETFVLTSVNTISTSHFLPTGQSKILIEDIKDRK